MRRHPLTQRSFGLRGGILVASLLVTGVAACLPTTGTQTMPISVTVTSGPGETLAFEPAEVRLPASRPISMTFRNASMLAHNLTFTAGLTGATRTIVEPGTSDVVRLDPPDPGAYPFACTIHVGMVGKLIVSD